jgi:predicted dehydrogenase
MSRGLVYRWRPSIGKKQPSPVPPKLNYDIWQGPAQERPFSERHGHHNWHWYWEYGNGDVGNQGIHETDMCMWGLAVDSFPTKVTSMGGKFLWDDDKETPEVQTSLYHYPDEQNLIQFEVRHWSTNDEHGAAAGNIFYGPEGYLVVHNYDRYAGGDHFANFIKAVQSRKTSDQNGPVETAHLASGLARMGNISYRLGRQLTFAPKAEKFVGDSEANQMLKRNYRRPYVVPEKVERGDAGWASRERLRAVI